MHLVNISAIYGTNYSSMDQAKFVEDSLFKVKLNTHGIDKSSLDLICSFLAEKKKQKIKIAV